MELPKEPTEIFIEVGETSNRVAYWYMPDDTIGDVYKFISERTRTNVADVLSLQLAKFGGIGKSMVEVPFMLMQKLKKVPIAAGDELEVRFRSSIDEQKVVVASSPSGSEPGELPGFFNVKVKLAGMKMFTVPIPRLARGSVFRGIVEDRAALVGHTVQLRRNSRDGAEILDEDLLTDLDTFFWATLELKEAPIQPVVINKCISGQVRVLTSAGRAHFYSYNCKTSAQDVRLALENLGLLPSSSNSPYGIILSSKGFFHNENIDTMKETDFLVDNGVQNNGVLFVTVACPTTNVYFVYRDKSLPQLLNCTTTCAYLAPVLNRVTGNDGSVQPKFTYLDRDLKRQELDPNVPVMQQLKNNVRLIVDIEYPACNDNIVSSTPISPTPSPSAHVVSWDSEGDRSSPPPPNAIKLGDGTLLQHKSMWDAQEQLKHRQRLNESN